MFLTKPLGTGVLTTAAKAELCPPAALAQAYRLMATLNKAARDIMVRYRVHACTDVTGFGLLGHAVEMAQASGVALTLDAKGFDLLPEALALARTGILPEGMYRNRTFAQPFVDAGQTELAVQDLLYDPQTSGGLLIAVDPADADALWETSLRPSVPSAQRIGKAAELYRRRKNHPALTAAMASSARPTSSSVVNQPKDSRTLPLGNVPSVL